MGKIIKTVEYKGTSVRNILDIINELEELKMGEKIKLTGFKNREEKIACIKKIDEHSMISLFRLYNFTGYIRFPARVPDFYWVYGDPTTTVIKRVPHI